MVRFSGDYDPIDDDSGSDDTGDTGPRGPGGSPSVPGGSDPGPAPDPDPDPSPGPSTGGGSPSVPGGSDPGPAPDPDPDPEPSPGPSTGGGSPSVPGGTDPTEPDPRPAGETTVLDDLGQAYTETVSEPVGDFTAATNPIAQAEQATLGTDRLASVSEGFGEGVAEIGNVPGNTAAAIDAAQALDRARGRSRDQVRIGGVPTGVTVPDPEGQEANAEAAAGVAAGAAESAAESPFETTGRLAGGAIGGSAATRGIARAARRTGEAPDSDARLPSGGSDIGIGGRGSLLEDVTARIDESRAGDFLADTRAQQQIGRQRSPGDRDTGSTTIDAGDIGEREDMTGEIARQTQEQTIFEQEQRFGDIERESVPDAPRDTTNVRDTGSDIGGGIGSRATIEPADGVGSFGDNFDAAIRASNTELPTRDLRDTLDDTIAPVNDPTGIAPSGAIGASSATGRRLDPLNDPTGIAADSATDAAGEVGLGGRGTGVDTLGTIGEVNDPTDIAPTDGTDTGTTVDTGTTTDTTGGLGVDTGSDTDTGAGGAGDTRTEPIPQLRGSTAVGTQQTPGSATDTAASTDTVAEPDVATDIGAGGFSAARGFGFGGGTSTPRTPRGEEEQQDEEEPAALFGLGVDADRIDSGISSGRELADEIAADLGDLQ